MTFARLRKVAILCIVLMLAGLIPVCAGAAGLETKTSATPAEIKNFGEQVTVSIEITNNTGAAIGPVTLLDPDDKPVAAFGENGSAMLAAGEKIAVEDVHAVTEKEAGAKNIVYKMRYSDVNEDGEVVSIVKKVNIPVSFNGTVVQLTAEREISAGAARKGDTFLIVYTLTNTGTVDIKDIKVSETATKKVETVSGTLKPGEQKKVSFMVSMGGSDMISSATITFRANDEAQTTTVGEQVIRFGEPNLSLIVSCDDRDVIIGGTAQLKITFENKGTISYSNITVKDEKAGVLLEGLSVEAGETQTYTADVTLQGPTEFALTATMDDNTGRKGVSLNGNKLTVNAFDPDKKVNLTLNLTADETGAPDFPADVKFILTVTNTSNVTAKNITVYQKDVTLATIPELKPGMTVTIPRLISVSAPGKFQWTASCKDELGNKMTFESEVIQFTREPAATAAPVTTPRAIPPVPTMVPFELREAELKAEFEDTISRDERLKKIMNVALPVLIVLTLAVLVLLIVAIIMRIIAAAKHASAYDSVDLVSQRDFKAVADSSEKKEPSEPSAEVPGDFRKESDYEPAVDLNDDSLTIGASGGSDSKPAEEAPAKEEPPKAEEPEEAPAAPAERHAVKREDPSEEE